MTRLVFGPSIGSEGVQVGTMVVPSGTATPDSFNSFLETPEGVRIQVVWHTQNKATADRYEDDLIQRMGWKVSEMPAKDEPATLVDDLILAWMTALAIPCLLVFAALVIVFCLEMADFIHPLTSRVVFKNTMRFLVISIPIIGVTLSGVAFFTHSSAKKHD